MPTISTAKPGLISVPTSHDVPVIAVDLGADGFTPLIRRRAIDHMIALGLEKTLPDPSRPPVAHGWSATFHDGHLSLNCPDHIVYEGELILWPSLTDAILANGWVLLYVGHIDLRGSTDMMTAIRAAVDQGHCASGVIPARIPAPEPS